VSFLNFITLSLIAIVAGSIFLLICERFFSGRSHPRSTFTNVIPDDQTVRLSPAAKQFEREMELKKPFFRREVIQDKVKSLFPAHGTAEILCLLDEYGTESWQCERERVQLAVLKLSEGNLELLRDHLNAAKSDFRDAIVPAEYPGQSQDGFVGWAKLSEAEKERISNEDNQQYLAWLQQ